jgi:MFS family permease
MTGPPLASVDQVREDLRKLGYLDSGLDRFVLGAAGSPSAVKASAAAALRVGVAGGVLLGAALTLAAAGLDRRLRSDPRDLAVLFLYLVALSGAATAVAAFLGGLAAGWAGRRLGRTPGPGLARNVGLGLALLGIAYLALWWLSHGSELSVAAQIVAVVLGVGIASLLGRFGSLAAVAVLSAGGVAERLPQASLSRRHMLPLLALAVILFGGGVAAASYLASAAGAEAPDFAVVPTGLRVRVLGIDGLDRRMVDQLRGRGELPRLDALLRSGAHARLTAEPEQVPAIVWTTIATGRGPEVHGIQSAGARRLAGMRTPVAMGEASRFERALGAAADLLRLTRTQPATSVLRGAKTFWNVASEKGLRVGVVNWWATWPADSVNGYTVTDRALFKLEKGGPFDREVYPPEAFDRLRPLATSASEPDRARWIDRFCLEAARLMREGGAPDVEAVYLPGMDIFTMQQVGEVSPSDLPELEARLDAVRSYYRFVDGLVGEVVDGLQPQDVLILVGDPGRLARRSAAPAEGLVLLSGGPVIATDLGAVSERDVAPTALHLAGLPRSRELDGGILEAALGADFRQAHPLRTVESYGRRRAAQPAESAFDRDMLEELRSLGYIR